MTSPSIAATPTGGEQQDVSPPPTHEDRGSGSQLTKVTVNLVPRSVVALDDASARTNDTKTETINRALQLWAWCQSMIDSGAQFRMLTREGREMDIKIF